jgi:hypothetical protein
MEQSLPTKLRRAKYTDLFTGRTKSLKQSTLVEVTTWSVGMKLQICPSIEEVEGGGMTKTIKSLKLGSEEAAAANTY